MTDIRVTQTAIEVLTSSAHTPTARVTQASIEVLTSTSFSPTARVTQLALEVLTSIPPPPPPDIRVTRTALEVITDDGVGSDIRATRTALGVLTDDGVGSDIRATRMVLGVLTDDGDTSQVLTRGPFVFPTLTESGNFIYSDPVANNQNLPQVSNTARRWCWHDAETVSTDVGPTSGQSGDPEGYLYIEATSPTIVGDEFELQFADIINAADRQWQLNFYTNQRGDDNNATCQVQVSEGGGSWVDVGAEFGGSGDSDKVATAGTQIWSSRSVDLSNGGLNVDSVTRVRIKLTIETTDTVFHNDYGIDTVELVGTLLASGSPRRRVVTVTYS